MCGKPKPHMHEGVLTMFPILYNVVDSLFAVHNGSEPPQMGPSTFNIEYRVIPNAHK